MIRYLKISQFACDVTFGIFLLSWFITRHVLFLFVIKAVHDTPKLFTFVWDPANGAYAAESVFLCFNTLLISLQVR
jgi:acyl-CoA-dependent ceramide synthase